MATTYRSPAALIRPFLSYKKFSDRYFAIAIKRWPWSAAMRFRKSARGQ